MEQHQSGFKRNFSCETVVNYLINRCQLRGKKKIIMAIFLDSKSAFETIDREILIQKLNMCGIKKN